MLAIWLPTYKRPHTLQKVATNIEQTTKNPFKLYFGVEPEDKESYEAAKATGHSVVVNKYSGGYSNTIQTMYEESSGPFAFHANDDFEFLPNWDEVPISMFENEKVMVVGCRQRPDNDNKSAICFIRRKYIEEQSGVVDMPNRVFYPYNHNYQDTEFTETAQSRGVWAGCDAPCINHKHPGFIGGSKDATYLKNDATVNLDKQTFDSRKQRGLW